MGKLPKLLLFRLLVEAMLASIGEYASMSSFSTSATLLPAKHAMVPNGMIVIHAQAPIDRKVSLDMLVSAGAMALAVMLETISGIMIKQSIFALIPVPAIPINTTEIPLQETALLIAQPLHLRLQLAGTFTSQTIPSINVCRPVQRLFL